MTHIVKKGLLIGINYTNTINELNGCINDTENLRTFLTTKQYFTNDELTYMNDKQPGTLYPSKSNIQYQIKELVTFANTNVNNDVYLFLSYSGHGSTLVDTSGDEVDGQDEVLCPIDCTENGYIVDDDLKRDLIDQLSSNVTLFVLIDACHSGTVLDLKYNYTCDIKNAYSVYGIIPDSKCKVVMISGCRDDQTSADAYISDHNTHKKKYQGVMTASFIDCYNENISTKTLINDMIVWLKKNQMTQVPQLSSGQLINIEDDVLLSKYKKCNTLLADIKSVTYGANNHLRDVTNTFKNHFKSGKNSLLVSNKAFGDPIHGVVKQLYITYTSGQIQKFVENTEITINTKQISKLLFQSNLN